MSIAAVSEQTVAEHLLAIAEAFAAASAIADERPLTTAELETLAQLADLADLIAGNA